MNLKETLIYWLYRRWFSKLPKVENPAVTLIEETFEIVAIDSYHTHIDWFRFGTAADFVANAQKQNIEAVFEMEEKGYNLVFFFYIYEDKMYCVELPKEIEKQ